MSIRKIWRVGVISAIATMLAVQPSSAVSLGADYVFSVFGLPAMKIDIDWASKGNRYKIDGKLRSAGIGRVFGNIKGDLSVDGATTDQGWQPQNFAMNYKGKDPWQGQAQWSGQTLTMLQTKPDNRRKGGSAWIPLDGPARNGFVDLFTGMVIESDTAGGVCGRTLDLFDGEMRMTLAMSAPKTVNLSIKGAPKKGVQCQARFTPVAGYSTKSSSRRHLAKQTIQIVWANPVGHYWVPASAVIPHKDATLRIKASRLYGKP
ncbi:DUF3108 domain-containing protein [Notoacmeibacter sp. MSK16QG-6]|uniref:DUF3108 domain-containing protein n=1 Tax=Notoacmeibacter sp. MSK16QG-6 TaxID=2957982 RepID=UPI0020A1A1E4|nr:DUF3108 domain-containing protein [Notoacmeibacter sp. MSK16QG-6]MCP1199996.1 DUF3108 domain-containing protein [Notoacmeibacter sp. MSK16QG-6]